MASKSAIEKYINQFPRWANQPEAFMGYITRVGNDISEHPTALRVLFDQMLQEGRLCENRSYREAFNEFWSNPLEDHWGYRSDAAEEMIAKFLADSCQALTVANIEYVWPEIKPKLSVSAEFQAHQRAQAQSAKDAADRPVLTAQLLHNFEANLGAEIRRTGDVQKNVAAYLDRETSRLGHLSIQQLRQESQALVVDNTKVDVENARSMGLGVTELRAAARAEQPPQQYQPRRQAYGNNGNYKPLPPTYKDQPWTYRLLYSMSGRELDAAMKDYGPALDRAVAANKAKGIR